MTNTTRTAQTAHARRLVDAAAAAEAWIGTGVSTEETRNLCYLANQFSNLYEDDLDRTADRGPWAGYVGLAVATARGWLEALEWNTAAADAVATIARIRRPADGHIVLLSAILDGAQTTPENRAAATAQVDRIAAMRHINL